MISRKSSRWPAGNAKECIEEVFAMLGWKVKEDKSMSLPFAVKFVALGVVYDCGEAGRGRLDDGG